MHRRLIDIIVITVMAFNMLTPLIEHHNDMPIVASAQICQLGPYLMFHSMNPLQYGVTYSAYTIAPFMIGDIVYFVQDNKKTGRIYDIYLDKGYFITSLLDSVILGEQHALILPRLYFTIENTDINIIVGVGEAAALGVTIHPTRSYYHHPNNPNSTHWLYGVRNTEMKYEIHAYKNDKVAIVFAYEMTMKFNSIRNITQLQTVYNWLTVGYQFKTPTISFFIVQFEHKLEKINLTSETLEPRPLIINNIRQYNIPFYYIMSQQVYDRLIEILNTAEAGTTSIDIEVATLPTASRTQYNGTHVNSVISFIYLTKITFKNETNNIITVYLRDAYIYHISVSENTGNISSRMFALLTSSFLPITFNWTPMMSLKVGDPPSSNAIVVNAYYYNISAGLTTKNEKIGFIVDFETNKIYAIPPLEFYDMLYDIENYFIGIYVPDIVVIIDTQTNIVKSVYTNETKFWGIMNTLGMNYTSMKYIPYAAFKTIINNGTIELYAGFFDFLYPTNFTYNVGGFNRPVALAQVMVPVFQFTPYQVAIIYNVTSNAAAFFSSDDGPNGALYLLWHNIIINNGYNISVVEVVDSRREGIGVSFSLGSILDSQPLNVINLSPYGHVVNIYDGYNVSEFTAVNNSLSWAYYTGNSMCTSSTCNITVLNTRYATTTLQLIATQQEISFDLAKVFVPLLFSGSLTQALADAPLYYGGSNYFAGFITGDDSLNGLRVLGYGVSVLGALDNGVIFAYTEKYGALTNDTIIASLDLYIGRDFTNPNMTPPTGIFDREFTGRLIDAPIEGVFTQITINNNVPPTIIPWTILYPGGLIAIGILGSAYPGGFVTGLMDANDPRWVIPYKHVIETVPIETGTGGVPTYEMSMVYIAEAATIYPIGACTLTDIMTAYRCYKLADAANTIVIDVLDYRPDWQTTYHLFFDTQESGAYNVLLFYENPENGFLVVLDQCLGNVCTSPSGKQYYVDVVNDVRVIGSFKVCGGGMVHSVPDTITYVDPYTNTSAKAKLVLMQLGFKEALPVGTIPIANFTIPTYNLTLPSRTEISSPSLSTPEGLTFNSLS